MTTDGVTMNSLVVFIRCWVSSRLCRGDIPRWRYDLECGFRCKHGDVSMVVPHHTYTVVRALHCRQSILFEILLALNLHSTIQ